MAAIDPRLKLSARAARKYLFALALAACLEKAAYAKTDVQLILNTLYQSGHGGKQVFDGSGDQTLSLYEPVLYIDSLIDHNTSVFGSVAFDVLSSASAKAFDTGTGASGAKKSGGDDGSDGGGATGLQSRLAADAGFTKRTGSWAFTPTAGYSSELSYRSAHGGLNVQKFFAEDNFVLSGGVFHFADSVDPWDLAKKDFAGFRSKITDSANVSATQILSANDIALAGLSYTTQNGFLEGTRNTVSTGTVTERASEFLPGAREKWTANARYVRSLGETTAFHLDYRYYADTWKIRAQTWEPSLAFSFSESAGIFRLLYRRYSQTAARYYADSFAGTQKFMTSDSDLAKFTADEEGAQMTYSWEAESGTDWTAGATALYYKRSNDLQALVLQLSLTAKY